MLSEKEFESVSTLGPFDRYRYFIKRIVDSGELWTLRDLEGNLTLSKVDERLLLSFWSAEEYLESCRNGAWEHHIPECIQLNDLEKEVIPTIQSGKYLIDVFPVNNKSGFVVTLDEFIDDLNIELSNYDKR